MVRKHAQRFLLALGLALLLPGVAGAAGFGPAEHALWKYWASPVELFARLSESWGELTGTWTHGGAVDPNGVQGTDGGGSADPNGVQGTDAGGAVDPNG